MVAVLLLLPFQELFKVIYPNRHWYKVMTSLDNVNNLINGIVDVICGRNWPLGLTRNTVIFDSPVFLSLFFIPLQFMLI